MKKQYKWFSYIAFAAASLLLVFTNCSDVKVQEMPSVVEVVSIKPDISICSVANTKKLQDRMKITFIIDMSGSNLRPAATATDKNMLRLAAIRDFITGHPNFEYKVIPFSEQVLSIANCEARFGTAAEAVEVMDALKSIQQQEDPTKPAIIMGTTYYGNALSCGEKSLAAESAYYNDPLFPDRQQEIQEIHYKTFFVTDGQPSELEDSNDKVKVINAMKETVYNTDLIANAAGSAGFQLIPVFYGPLKTEMAMETLSGLGSAGNWITSSPIVINGKSFSPAPLIVEDVSKLNFDRLLSYTVNEQYKILEFNVVNLNAITKDGVLHPDSDSDGVMDSLDPAPGNRRSNTEYLLDGICAKFGAACKKPATCDQNKYNSMRFNQCDMQALNLKDGLDSDNDNIPDLVEFAYRTNPVVHDSFSDADNDGKINIVEVRAGSSPDDPVPLRNEFAYLWDRIRVESKSAECPSLQDYWDIQVRQLPTIPVQEYSDPAENLVSTNPILSYSHGRNENVFLVYYVQQLVNGKTGPGARELYATTIRIPHGVSSAPSLSPSDFIKVGDLNGTAEYFLKGP